MTLSPLKTIGVALTLALGLTACESASSSSLFTSTERSVPSAADKTAILAMAGDYRVTFDFTEKVAFKDGYTLKPQKLSYAREVVRVIDERPGFVSLQHILVASAGPNSKVFFPIKHWRQDWQWQPNAYLEFKGGNAWQMTDISEEERKGAWSQTVYQVDDAPRYSGYGKWKHTNGISVWEAAPSWRPLPRRDATKRDDYDVIEAVNRHAITPNGWVHEQDNAKLILRGETPQVLAVEVGVNTYVKARDYPVEVAEDYWLKTEAFWAGIRTKWTALEQGDTGFFALTIQGEPEELYMQVLGIASAVADGELTADQAIQDAVKVIDDYTMTEPSSLRARLTPTTDVKKSR
ncbi:hypothetical protein QGN29_05305 [Temperatibacter marinus]|uniref:Uncharacterized protein n=1 Tax=Temperatibacter marinus TaxID=1456591 RepID=A0AA52EJ79_9PROT|nr:DUF6607 family protein [Temperatibacter marinus]WND03790.1 hypothetical protein QGN29_05305 [Temperatibacter marinus]